jgi:hypothetical protein
MKHSLDMEKLVAGEDVFLTHLWFKWPEDEMAF